MKEKLKSNLYKKSQVVYIDKILSLILIVFLMIFIVEMFQVLQSTIREENNKNIINAFMRLNRMDYVLLDRESTHGYIFRELELQNPLDIYCTYGTLFVSYEGTTFSDNNWLNVVCYGKGRREEVIKVGNTIYLLLHD